MGWCVFLAAGVGGSAGAYVVQSGDVGESGFVGFEAGTCCCGWRWMAAAVVREVDRDDLEVQCPGGVNGQCCPCGCIGGYGYIDWESDGTRRDAVTRRTQLLFEPSNSAILIAVPLGVSLPSPSIGFKPCRDTSSLNPNVGNITH